MVIWNSLCRRLFDRLRLEDTVCILGYRVKRAYGKQGGVEVSVNPRNPPGQVLILTGTAGRAACTRARSWGLGEDLARRPHQRGRRGVVREARSVLPPADSVLGENHRALTAPQIAARYPAIQWAFYRPTVAAHMPDGARFDVVARIQHVGRCERQVTSQTPRRYVPSRAGRARRWRP